MERLKRMSSQRTMGEKGVPEVHQVAKKLRNMSESDRRLVKLSATSVFQEPFFSVVEKIKEEKKLLTHSTKRRVEDTAVIKSKNQKKSPSAFLFAPVALFVAKPVKNEHAFDIYLRITICPSLFVSPLSESAIFHIYSSKRYFEFTAISQEARERWVERLQNCRELSSPKIIYSGLTILCEDVINGFKVTEFSEGPYDVLGLRFDVEITPENSVFYRDQRLLKCSIEKLIEHITKPTTISKESTKKLSAFLLTYKIFMTPSTLLKLLLARISRKKFSDNSERSHGIRQQIAHILLQWTSLYPEDLRPSQDSANWENAEFESIQDDLRTLLDHMETIEHLVLSREEVTTNLKQNTASTWAFQPPSIVAKRRVTGSGDLVSMLLQVTWLDLRAVDTAQHLTLQGKKLHQRVTARSFILPEASRELLHMRKEREELSQNVFGSLDMIENISLRIHLMTHFIHILHHCLNLANYEHAYAIFKGLVVRPTTEFEQLSEHTMTKWESAFSIFGRLDHYLNHRRARSKEAPLVPAMELECRHLECRFNTKREEILQDSLIDWRNLVDFATEVFDVVGGMSYSFEEVKETRQLLFCILKDPSRRRPLPQKGTSDMLSLPPLHSAEEIDASEVALEKMRKSLFVSFLDSKEENTLFHEAISQLTPTHLQELIQIDQLALLDPGVQPLRIEISWHEGECLSSLILSPPGTCNQFHVYKCQIRLTSCCDIPVPFRFLNRQSGPAAVRFVPWNGTVPPGEIVLVQCKILLMEDGRHRVPVQLLLPNRATVCLVVEALARPFSKLREIREMPQLAQLVGRGGSGDVYQTEIPAPPSIEFQRPSILRNLETDDYNDNQSIVVAVKQFKGIDDLDERQLDEFRREVMLLSDVEHKNIIQGVAFCRQPPSIFMELASEGDLSSLIKKGPIDPETAYSIILECAKAMEHLHDLGYIHRDIKPGNVLIHQVAATSLLQAKLCDFGGASFTFDSNQTRSAHGTIRFEAPEVIEQYSKKDPNYQFAPASDVFAFGMLVYCIIAGTCEPLESLTSHNVGEAILKGERPPLPCVSTEWQNLITLCWHQDQSRRQTFPQIVETLSSLPPPTFQV